ncbi:MAG: DUF445 family protein [Candidatus Brocadiae bacterium]|nr:DUF445 family protein [Candidatus Brocadiia bacterium]
MKRGQITFLVTLSLMILGLILPGQMRKLIFAMGITGFVGYGTNVLAIRMLFDRIYLIPKWKKFPLPYSGILEIEREKIACAIGWVVSQRLVSRDALLGMIVSKEFRSRIRSIVEKKLQSIAQDKSIVSKLVQDVETALIGFVENDIFRDNLQELLYQHLGKVGNVLIGSRIFRDKEKLTPYLQKEFKNVLEAICRDPKFYQKIQITVENLAENCFSLQSLLEESLQAYSKETLRELLENVDFYKIVKDEVSNFPPGELSGIVLKITAENLDWLEVWGGFLGILAGILFWTMERYIL